MPKEIFLDAMYTGKLVTTNKMLLSVIFYAHPFFPLARVPVHVVMVLDVDPGREVSHSVYLPCLAARANAVHIC